MLLSNCERIGYSCLFLPYFSKMNRRNQVFAALDIPVNHAMKRRSLFKRDFFDKYFEEILMLLNETACTNISVSGAAGVGSSSFYMYFVMRFRQRYPAERIILAAYSDDYTLRECIEYRPGLDDGQRLKEVPNFFPNDLPYIICDGRPLEPLWNGIVIHFTRCNSRWFERQIKYCRTSVVFLPSWSLPELLQANEALELGLDKQVIEDRFNFFGGVVRYCLSTCEEFVSAGKARVMGAIEILHSENPLKYGTQIPILLDIMPDLHHDDGMIHRADFRVFSAELGRRLVESLHARYIKAD